MNRAGSTGEQAKTEHEMGLEVRDYRHDDGDAFSAPCTMGFACSISVMN